MRVDHISPKLRAIEDEVDNFYLSNPLAKYPFATAAWYIMAVYEDLSLSSFHQSRTLSKIDAKAISDFTVVGLQYPLRWFWSTSSKKGSIPQEFNIDLYEAAMDIQLFSRSYIPFESVYTLASRKKIDLVLEDDLIRSERPYLIDSRYEAYDALRDFASPEEVSDPSSISEMIFRSVTISDNRFHYQLGRRLISNVLDYLTPLFLGLYELPSDWKFDSYSISDFRKVSSVLLAIAFIHKMARIYAIDQGVDDDGFLDCLHIVSKEKLIKRISRYSYVDSMIVESIISTLTFGSSGIISPDPALQPLIPLDNNLTIMPHLFLNSSVERNFITLLNRIPKEQNQYLRLVDTKEKHLVEQIRSSLKDFDFDYFHGHLPDRKELPDLDLAVICRKTKSAILLELKWFIGPSEIREVLEKGQEIQKGVNQQLKIKSDFEKDPALFYSFLSIDESYTIDFVVISQNIIGPDWAQHPDIPVITIDHFLEKISEDMNLRCTASWIRRRGYLPVENEDYKVYEDDYPILNWKVRWHGIGSLERYVS